MFENRQDAGEQLAAKIKEAIKDNNYAVAGILRGGIVVAKVIADSLDAELMAIVVRKIGAPQNQELAIGAVGRQKIVYWDENLIEKLNISPSYKMSALKDKIQEVKNLEEEFFLDKKGFDFKEKQTILIDDGVATGTTVLCAQKILKKQKVKKLILATPVISKETFRYINKYFDNIIVLEKVDYFYAVGQFYKDFPQVGDDEVIALLSS